MTDRKTLKFCMQGANESGYDQHPQEVMKILNIQYDQAESVPMVSGYFFYGCLNIPEPLPKFLNVSDNKPNFKGSFLNGESGEITPTPEKENCRAGELYEFAASKWGQHIIAIRLPGGGGRELFDVCALLNEKGTYAEYLKIKEAAAIWAKGFVETHNAGLRVRS